MPVDNKPRYLLPPVYLLSAVISMTLLHFFLPIVTLLIWPYILAGVAVVFLSFILFFSAIILFKLYDTPVRPFEESTSLIVEGPYRYSRNPIYLGMVVMLTGIWLSFGTLSPVFIIPVFAVLMEIKFIRKEESMLVEAFGDDYRDYQKRVARWWQFRASEPQP